MRVLLQSTLSNEYPHRLAKQHINRRPIGRIDTSERPHHVAFAINQEIATQLKGIFALWNASNLAAACDELEILPDQTGTKDLSPRSAFQSEGTVRITRRIGEQRKWKCVLLQITSQRFRRTHRDGKNVYTDRSKFLGTFHHLDQVDLTRNSGEMAEEDE